VDLGKEFLWGWERSSCGVGEGVLVGLGKEFLWGWGRSSCGFGEGVLGVGEGEGEARMTPVVQSTRPEAKGVCRPHHATGTEPGPEAKGREWGSLTK